MREGLAPSYKAICIALLRNDMALTTLGFATTSSEVYSALKRIELQDRPRLSTAQLELFK